MLMRVSWYRPSSRSGSRRVRGGTAVAVYAAAGLDRPARRCRQGRVGLISRVLTPGTGAQNPAATDIVTVHYTGWVASDGRMFDSSIARGAAVHLPAEQGDGRLARVRAADDRGREAPLLDSGEPRLQGAGGPAHRHRGVRHRADRGAASPTIPPPDVKGPPADAKKTSTGLAYKVLKPGAGHVILRPGRE